MHFDELVLEFLAVLFGVAILFYSYKTYAFFKSSSLAKPMQVIGFAFFFFVVHAIVHFLNEFFHWEVPFLAQVPEFLFFLLMIYGIYLFKSEFERFEWVKEVEPSVKVIS